MRSLALVIALALTAPAMAQQQFGSDGYRFLKAVKETDGATATDLLSQPGSTVVNHRGEDGNGALHMVVRSRNVSWLGFLLSKGADPNIADAHGDTPLILASRSGFSEGVARLLMKRALVDKDNRLGETALIAAVQTRQAGIVRMLLEAGANPDKQDHAAGYSARDYARRDTRSTELLRLIETVKAKKTKTVGPVIR